MRQKELLCQISFICFNYWKHSKSGCTPIIKNSINSLLSSLATRQLSTMQHSILALRYHQVTFVFSFTLIWCNWKDMLQIEYKLTSRYGITIQEHLRSHLKLIVTLQNIDFNLKLCFLLLKQQISLEANILRVLSTKANEKQH